MPELTNELIYYFLVCQLYEHDKDYKTRLSLSIVENHFLIHIPNTDKSKNNKVIFLSEPEHFCCTMCRKKVGITKVPLLYTCMVCPKQDAYDSERNFVSSFITARQLLENKGYARSTITYLQNKFLCQIEDGKIKLPDWIAAIKKHLEPLLPTRPQTLGDLM